VGVLVATRVTPAAGRDTSAAVRLASGSAG
jgi:hypothetical protein